jgi:hypothetical protein
LAVLQYFQDDEVAVGGVDDQIDQVFEGLSHLLDCVGEADDDDGDAFVEEGVFDYF